MHYNKNYNFQKIYKIISPKYLHNNLKNIKSIFSVID